MSTAFQFFSATASTRCPQLPHLRIIISRIERSILQFVQITRSSARSRSFGALRRPVARCLRSLITVSCDMQPTSVESLAPGQT